MGYNRNVTSTSSAGALEHGVLERSQAMLSAAVLASEYAQELASLATSLEVEADGLDDVLTWLAALHLQAAWSGVAASASRRRLHHNYKGDLWLATTSLSGLVAELRYIANQAQAEADRLWAQWRLAVYSGQIVTQFHFWG